MPCCLILLAFRVALDKVDDPLLHLWPPDVSSDKLNGFVLSHMACHFRVVFGLENCLLEGPILRDPVHALPVEEPVFDFEDSLGSSVSAPPSGLPRVLGFLDFSVIQHRILLCRFLSYQLPSLLVFFVLFFFLPNCHHEFLRPFLRRERSEPLRGTNE